VFSRQTSEADPQTRAFVVNKQEMIFIMLASKASQDEIVWISLRAHRGIVYVCLRKQFSLQYSLATLFQPNGKFSNALAKSLRLLEKLIGYNDFLLR
jgi:hypothetical protein